MTIDKNSLPSDSPERRQLVTVTAAPNTYITYPAYGELYAHSFDINGKPSLYGFRQYRADGEFTALVRLGFAQEVTFTPGFVPGAKIANTPAWVKDRRIAMI